MYNDVCCTVSNEPVLIQMLGALACVGIAFAGTRWRKRLKMTNNAEKKSGGVVLKAGIILALAVAVGAVIYAKQQNGDSATQAEAAGMALAASGNVDASSDGAGSDAVTKKLPRLVDLGADKCVPCKMMAPILEELKKEYADRFEVQFIDVWKNPDAGAAYNIRMIPTQIFYDAEGKERKRHTGFMSKEDILAVWKELDVI
jgi:thioredoxin 1